MKEKGKRYVLNSAVITGPGLYRYRLVTVKEAAEWVKAGDFVSRVGYADTADYVRDFSGVRPPLSRESTVLEPGDEALIVRIKYRVTNPAEKGKFAPGHDDWELGVLERIS